MLVAVEPFSLVDYPGHIVATVFFGGCNFRCGYCQNRDLVTFQEKSGASPADVIDFLKTRRGLLDGVCLTGGEPLLSPDMPELVWEIKKLGFRLKLDTNGSNLDQLIDISSNLDYIAMDIKASPGKYDFLTGCKNSWEKAVKTIIWIKESGIPYEFRTTVIPDWHTFEELSAIRNFLGEQTPWVLQQFHQPPTGVLDGKVYEAWPDSWLRETGRKLNCQVRGLY